MPVRVETPILTQGLKRGVTVAVARRGLGGGGDSPFFVLLRVTLPAVLCC